MNKLNTQESPSPYKTLFWGIAFLVIAIIAVILILVLPDNKVKSIEESKIYSFKYEGNASFTDESNRVLASFEIEIAETPDEMKTGLMYRDSLSLNQAMLFVYEKPDELSFWMKNTYLPLDIIFIGSDSSIVSIGEKTTPFSEQSIVSKGLAQYVLEINAGLASAKDLKIGDKFNWTLETKK